LAGTYYLGAYHPRRRGCRGCLVPSISTLTTGVLVAQPGSPSPGKTACPCA
jgi:hypothetical protein